MFNYIVKAIIFNSNILSEYIAIYIVKTRHVTFIFFQYEFCNKIK